MSMINQTSPRLDKAFKLLDFVFDITETHATVISNGNKYRVNHRTKSCICRDSVCRHIQCKHLYAVLIKIGEMKVDKV